MAGEPIPRMNYTRLNPPTPVSNQKFIQLNNGNISDDYKGKAIGVLKLTELESVINYEISLRGQEFNSLNKDKIIELLKLIN